MLRSLILICCTLATLSATERRTIQFRLGTSLREFFAFKFQAACQNKPEAIYQKPFLKQSAIDKKFIQLLNEKFSLSESQLEKIKQIPAKYIWNPHNWNSYVWDHSKSYSDYHMLISEIAQKIIPQALEELQLKPLNCLPVIHYRLSDVPFCRNMAHHLQYYAFYDAALNRLQRQGVDVSKILILYSFRHITFNHGLSNKKFEDVNREYLNDFIKYLHSRGHEVIVQSNSTLEDFATMVFAPGLIGSESAFSLFAGLANKGCYISPPLGKEIGDHHKTVTNCPFILPMKPLLHCQVSNYYNLKDVFEKLRINPCSS